MSLQHLTAEPGLGRLISDFFQRSVGEWRSERRYFTLPDGKVQEVESLITIHYLAQGCEELRSLAALHGLENETLMTCGAAVTWDSKYSILVKKWLRVRRCLGLAAR
jgi:hypothetical protein